MGTAIAAIVFFSLQSHPKMKQLFVAIACLLLFTDTAVSAETAFVEPQLETKTFLSEEDRSFLAHMKEIKKCVDPHWMPLEKIDRSNQHVGVIADILKLVEQKIGIPFKLVPTKNWPESLEKLKSRECDIVTSDTVDGVSRDFYLKTVPFLELKNAYITRKDTPVQWDFNAIKDRRIGVPKGYPTIELIRKKYGKVNIVEVKDVDEGLKKVSSGEIYAFVDLLSICSYSIQRQSLTNLKIAGHLEIPFPIVMAVRSDMPRLAQILNKIFATTDNSIINDILYRWVNMYDLVHENRVF